MKIIRIKSCHDCPQYGQCDTWKKLNQAEILNLAISNHIYDFVLTGCHLEDDPDAETNTQG